MFSSDVETFNGKIVYNLDGSAFIIDAGSAHLSSSSATPTATTTPTPLASALTSETIAPTNQKGVDKFLQSVENKGRVQGQSQSVADTKPFLSSESWRSSPKVHSFRVVSAQDASSHCQDPSNASPMHKHKPILMCFICKLSFGNVNSFSLHANTEHRLNLKELEQQLLKREYSSAIIQRNMDEEPQISFLQPLDINTDDGASVNNIGTASLSASELLEPIDRAAVDGKECTASTSHHSHLSVENCRSLYHDPSDDDEANNKTNDDGTMAHKASQPPTSTLLELEDHSALKFSSLNSAIAKTNSNPLKNSASEGVSSAPTIKPSISSASASTSTSTPPLPKPVNSLDNLEGTPAPAPAPTPEPSMSEESQVNSPPEGLKATSTDNISNDKSTNKRNKDADTKITYSSLNKGDQVNKSPNVPPSALSSTTSTTSSDSSQPLHIADSDAALTAAEILQKHFLLLQQQQVAAGGGGGTGGEFPPIQAQTQAQISSFQASLAALANEQNSRGVKLLTEFLQLHHQNQLNQSFPTSCPEHADFKGVDCKTCELIDIQHRMRSPATPQSQSQPQPQRSPNANSSGLSTSMPISPSASSAASVGNATASSFTIGACSDHINGRPQGVDCARCELLLSSARLNSGVQMSTRNSCKTLKCPQCNWHYKYQETLEIHMREKHPDGESACGYCLAGQQHPRLARGESYSCGYKPYRCEICNYSTTTKGNLSIHMQSDKHLNNMQELNSSQNMVAAAAAAAGAKLLLSSPSPQGANQVVGLGVGSQQMQQPPLAPSSGSNTSSTASVAASSVAVSGSGTGTVSAASLKVKPSFRCEICSYETSVARNLRIHMTSEKHTHNMAVLQNNIKHIQAFNFLQQQHQHQSASTSATGSNNSFLPVSEVALADMAYNQALMIQLLQQNASTAQQHQHHQLQHQLTGTSKLSPHATTSPSPVSTPDQLQAPPYSFSPKSLKLSQGIGMTFSMLHANESGPTSGDALDSLPASSPELWPTALFSCLICECFSTNNIEDLNQHLVLDRSRQASSASSDIMVIHNNNYICRLCNYKTNLKANFQLHSKTDKHLQKLNFINHIREGGARNEYKLQNQLQLASNMVQLKCNCCEFHTNSIQKLALHTQQMRHDTMRMIFQHLLFIIQQNHLRKSLSYSSEGETPLGQECHAQQKALCCQLCNFVAKNLHEMVLHVKGLRHMQVEQFICLQRRNENLDMLPLGEVFKVTEKLPPSSTEEAISDNVINLGTTSVGANTDNVYGVSIASTADGNILSPTSVSSCSTPCDKTQLLRAISPVSNFSELGLGAAMPKTLLKCNLCDYFGQSKKDIALHIESLHPGVESDDYISIPTNAAALQAFQTAVAAAALAAVQRCNVGGGELSMSAAEAITTTDAKVYSQGDGDGHDDVECPIGIKRERLVGDDDLVTNALSPKSELHPRSSSVSCPLCLEGGFCEKALLESHLTNVHSVTRDGLARLLQLVDHTVWRSPSTTSQQSTKSVPEGSSSKCSNVSTADDYLSMTGIKSVGSAIPGASCQQCEANFKHEEQLLQHAQQTQHFPMQNGEYHCLAVKHASTPCLLVFSTLPAMIAHFKDMHMSLVISERHVYKYRCKQCSLAFKTQEKLTTHMLYHSMRDATKCSLCQRNFRSTQALQKHMEQTHNTERAATASPGDSSPSPKSNEMDKIPNTFNYTVATKGASESATLALRSSPQQDSEAKEVHESNLLSPNESASDPHQQFAVLTAALLKQQQRQQQQDTAAMETDGQLQLSSDEMQDQLHQQAKQTQQQISFGSLNAQSVQGLHNLQNLHQMQQLSAAAATSGMPINPVDMLNLMQFHHLMSLNFMNLAPPLIFGATGASDANSVGGGGAGGGGVPAGSSTGTTTTCLADLQQVCPGEASNIKTIPQTSASNNSQQQQHCSNQKRARTRITDDQLKILRAHFDINNSPSEESIMEMSHKANLPMKVVKHWFRNTLFKERQRNKDSPYNFNNPPSTTLNLEEYERTGQAKVTSLNDAPIPSDVDSSPATTSTATASSETTAQTTTAQTTVTIAITTTSTMSTSESTATEPTALALATKNPTTSNPTSTSASFGNISDYFRTQADMGCASKPGQEDIDSLPLPLEVQIKTEPQDVHVGPSEFEFHKKQQQQHVFNFIKQQGDAAQNQTTLHPTDNEQSLLSSGSGSSVQHYQLQQHHLQQQQQINCFETKSESESSEVLSRPPSPSNLYASMNDLLSQQLENMGSNMGPPKKLQIAGKSIEKHQSGQSSSSSASVSGLSSGLSGLVPASGSGSGTACVQMESNSSNSSNSSSSTSGGKRANRTRFTDYQIKVLQEFFENNSYPKDSDLEYLSKLLLLSPRVIVVWFQNARQKQRKIYENQPNNSLYENEESKKQNINYACKKCSLVFQRYYELIRHQKNHCFKEENNKKSAKAQIAAAQIAQNLSSEDSNSSMDIHHHAVSAGSASGLATQNLVGAVGVSAASAASALSGPQQFSSSPQHHLFSKSSSLTDFSPSTTPTPPQRERSNSLDQQRLSKYDCDRCELQFNSLESLREHQLMHLMNPTLFSASQSEATYGPFGSILQSLQQAAQQQQQQQKQQLSQPHPPPAKKRKYSESSSNAEESLSLGEFETSNKASQKNYEYLYQYFMQNEMNSELKQQFAIQQQQSNAETDFEMDFLSNFYQQNELKKVGNYDFLLQYYRKNNEDPSMLPTSFSSSKKPSIEFLIQYYQLNESKKFFQLVASPQTTPDRPGSHPSSQKPIATADENFIGKQKEENEQKDHRGLDMKMEQDLQDVDERLNGISNDNDFNLNRKLNNNHSNANREDPSQDQVMGIIKKSNDNETVLTGHRSVSFDNIINGDKHVLIQQSKDNLHKLRDADKSQYFQNLEDFLDATMIENNSQMLTFNDDANPSPKIENLAATEVVRRKNESLSLDSSSTPTSAPPSKQNKRLRTTILPDQLNFLYECYQTESNPSRKMLEEISKKVNLKKRVVQVWFQNSRAKDKKSRNQRQYAHISDDNNSYDDSCSKEISNTNNLKSRALTLESVLSSGGSLVEPEPEPEPESESKMDQQLQDCQLCQISQVNMQKHLFTVEHICKVKELLEQTSEQLYNNSNASGSDNDNDSDRERRFYSLSKAFLLQQVASNVASSIMVPNSDTDSMSLINSDTREAISRQAALDLDISGNDGTGLANAMGNGMAVGGAIHHSQLAAGDINISVNNDDGEGIVEVVKKNSTGNRQPLMQQLYNRNHITDTSFESSILNNGRDRVRENRKWK